jgi:hypothetical protein
MAKFYTPTRLSENIAETPEGFLLCLAVPIARTGWMTYGEGETPLETGEDGIVHIYRDAKEVFRPQTIASFQGKAITIKHPIDFVVPDNWSYLAKGTLQNVRKSDELDEDGEECLLSDLLITEATAINLVKSGLREVSCGYEAEYEQTGKGEGRQFNIIGNHCALVEEGRAGSSYAINDHKGKVLMSKVIDRLKKKFGAKAVDDAMEEGKGEKKVTDQDAYDELVEKVSDLMERVEGLLEKKSSKDDAEEEEEKSSKDDAEEEPKKKPKDDKAKDDDEEGAESEILERLKVLEAAVAKLLKMEASEQSGDDAEEEEESEDDAEEEEEQEKSKDDDEEEEESEDDDKAHDDAEEKKEKKDMTGDTASRAEILSPGIKVTKNVKRKALEAAYGTKDGKAVIHALTGGKKPAFDSASRVATLFLAASELLKSKRGTGLERTKDANAFDSGAGKEEMTAEKMNEINQAAWARK